jgi:hypothetical protein
MKASASSRTTATIGINISKNTFHLVGLASVGRLCCVRSYRGARWWLGLPT